MVCLNDIGNPQDIHPRKKREAGLRFADAVLHIAYGKTERPLMGPIFKSMEVIKNKAIITFDYADGLKCEGKTLTWFEISADGETFVPAKAVIKNGKVEVSAKGIKIPKHVRFAWSNIAEPNLFNGAGLPASCFTTKE
jgi:sialate O-acetylesterase